MIVPVALSLILILGGRVTLPNRTVSRQGPAEDKPRAGSSGDNSQNLENPEARVQGPRAIYAPDPLYTEEARKAHVEGGVALGVTVGVDGSVKDVALILGDPLLISPAMDTVRQWRFEPKRVDGVPVEAVLTVCVTFRLLGRISQTTNPVGCTTSASSTRNEAPQILYQVRPVYPPKARKQHIEGEVVLRGTIGVGGSVRDLEVVSGDPLLAPAALDAVRQWRYRPMMKDGRAVELTTTVRINFQIEPPH